MAQSFIKKGGGGAKQLCISRLLALVPVITDKWFLRFHCTLDRLSTFTDSEFPYKFVCFDRSGFKVRA